MLTAPGLNERMDYLPLTLSLSDFGNLFWRRRRAPNTIKQSTRTRRVSADSTRLERAHGLPGGGPGFRIRTRPAWPLKNQRKRALVNDLSLKSSRARGA